MMDVQSFEEYLRKANLSKNTITAYSFALGQFNRHFTVITQLNLHQYKLWLIEQYKPATVNLRIRAMNCYLEFIGKEELKMTCVKVQQKPFLENVISNADYEYFNNSLCNYDELFWYFVIRFLSATGVRVSELIQITV